MICCECMTSTELQCCQNGKCAGCSRVKCEYCSSCYDWASRVSRKRGADELEQSADDNSVDGGQDHAGDMSD